MSTSDGLDEVADRLYVRAPADFVAARDEAVKAARAAGDRQAAAAIAKLRRPTVAAWLVNLLAFERPNELGELLDLGEELRAAQQHLRGPELRELASRRRAAVAALVAQAAELAVAAGMGRSSLPVTEVETTLVAALADEALGEVVRSGRLLKSGSYDGFGEAPRPRLQVIEGGGDEEDAPETTGKKAVRGRVAARPSVGKAAGKAGSGSKGAAAGKAASPEGAASPSKRATGGAAAPDTTESAAKAAGKRLTEAAAAMSHAQTAYQSAADAVEARTREVTDIEERLTQLRRDRVAAHAALLEAQNTQDSMDAARHAAQRALAAAERAAKRTAG